MARSRHAGGRAAQLRAGAGVLAALAIAAACGAPGATGASSSSVVSVVVPSATSIDASGCATGTANVTHFGSVLPGASVVTSSDCVVRFDSSNATASLRVRQQDELGGAMWQPTRGVLDATFDGPAGSGDGAFVLPVGPGDDVVRSSVIQDDGKLVLTGICSNGTDDDFCVARVHPDGSWDTTFDGPTGTGDGRFLLPIGLLNDRAFSSHVQDDGKLLLTGSCGSGTNSDFCAARLNPDGSWDTSFDGPNGDGDGRFLLPIGTGIDSFFASTVLDDGKVVLAGACENGVDLDFCAARINPDGSWDAAFDGPTGSGDGRFLMAIGVGGDHVRSVVQQDDGRVLLAGICHNGTNDDFCVARLEVDGGWDATYDGPSGTGNGRFLLSIGSGNDAAYSIGLQPNGNAVIAGACHNGTNEDFCAARLGTNGSWDASFDGPSGTGDGRFLLPIGAGDDFALTTILQDDGRLLLAHRCHNGTNEDFCAARLEADGSWDTSFDGPSGAADGRFLLPIGAGNDAAFASASADGRVVLAGRCHNGTDEDFCAARLDQGGRLEDYAGGSRDWSVGASMFGACLDSVAAGATATWSVNPGCALTNGTTWNAVPVTPSEIATTSVAGTLAAEARLRFGMRAAASQAPGDYVAPISFEVIAPAA